MSRTAAVFLSLILGIPLAAGLAPRGAVADDDDDWTVSAKQAAEKNPVAADATSIAAGKTTYENSCIQCHGRTGKGDGPKAAKLSKKPPDFTSKEMLEETDGTLFWKLTLGRRPMPSYERKLKPNERWQAVNYLRSLGPKPEKKTG